MRAHLRINQFIAACPTWPDFYLDPGIKTRVRDVRDETMAGNCASCAAATEFDAGTNYDVVIIGAGPCGLALLSALHAQEGNLTDEQQATMQARSRQNRIKKSEREALKVCVVDPAGAFLHEWRRPNRAAGSS